MAFPRFNIVIRALGVVFLSIFVALNIPLWTRYALRISPIFAIIVVIGTVLFVAKLWSSHSAIINQVIFHSARIAYSKLVQLKQNIVHLCQSDELGLKESFCHKLLRTWTLFMMAQTCYVPTSHFAWLHSLLACKLLMDISNYIKEEYERRQRQNQNGRPLDEYNAETSTPLQQQMSKPIRIAMQLGKGLLGSLILVYQMYYVNIYYVVATLTYFLITQNYMERPLTRILETAQLDTFEGLEQYYVIGFFGFIEIAFALFFMLWTLIQHHQFLMLIALYTNIYAGGKEVVNNAVSAAFTEWTILAHFDQATIEELQQLDDVCAICLQRMYKARKTPCKHYFHGHCLRRCMREKNACPICNKKFDFTY